jgi:hypothetical protein
MSRSNVGGSAARTGATHESNKTESRKPIRRMVGQSAEGGREAGYRQNTRTRLGMPANPGVRAKKRRGRRFKRPPRLGFLLSRLRTVRACWREGRMTSARRPSCGVPASVVLQFGRGRCTAENTGGCRGAGRCVGRAGRVGAGMTPGRARRKLARPAKRAAVSRPAAIPRSRGGSWRISLRVILTVGSSCKNRRGRRRPIHHRALYRARDRTQQKSARIFSPARRYHGVTRFPPTGGYNRAVAPGVRP